MSKISKIGIGIMAIAIFIWVAEVWVWALHGFTPSVGVAWGITGTAVLALGAFTAIGGSHDQE